MLALFRINDPFRLIIVALLLLSFRLPFWLDATHWTIPELSLLILAEKLNNGAVLYVDVWDNTPILTVWFYQLYHVIFGKILLPLHLIALIIIVYQAYIFNRFLIDFNVFNEKTFLPAFLYAVMMNICFDCLTLSMPLLALTFLLLVLRNILRPEQKTVDEDIFKSGFYLGIAALFYYPSLTFLILTLVGYIFFRTSSFKVLLNILYGFSTIILSFLVYLYYYDLLGRYFSLLIDNLPPFQLFSHQELIWLLVIPSLWAMSGFVMTLTDGHFINYQVRCQQFMILWAMTSVLVLLFSKQVVPADIVLLVPVFAFLTTHLLLIIRKKVVAELMTWVVVSSVLLVNFNTFFGFFQEWQKVNYDNLLVKTHHFPYQDKKILVLGYDKSYYMNNRLATPYLQWELAGKHFKHLNSYTALIEIHKHFTKDMPEIIVDEQKIFPYLLEKLPMLTRYYLQVQKNIYVFKQP